VPPEIDDSFAVDEHDHVDCVVFYGQHIHPDKEHCNAVNELIYAAKSWHVLLPQRQHEVIQGSYFFDFDPTDLDPEPLSLVRRVDTDDNDGRFTLMLSQHPLLGQSPAARRAMLYKWYCANAFVARFDLCMTPANRSELEQALELLGPRRTACIITHVAGVIKPRLYFRFINVENGITITSLLQWFQLFYDGPLSQRKLANIETGFGTGPRNPAQYKLVFDVVEEAYESDKTAINRVLRGIREGAISIQLDANRRIDVKLYLYEWLANSAAPIIADNRLSNAREKVCRMVGPKFRVLEYKAAMKKYV